MRANLQGCALALDLVLDCGLILHTSSPASHKIVFVNTALAERIGCESGEVGVNEGSYNVQVQSLEYHDTLSCKVRTGDIQINYDGYTTAFFFRSIPFGKKHSICVLKEFDEAELLRLFFNGCNALLGILEGKLECNTWRHKFSNKKNKGDTPEQLDQAERKHILYSTILQFENKIREAAEKKVPVLFDQVVPTGTELICGRFSFHHLATEGDSSLIGYVVHDITDLKETEKNLAESSKRQKEYQRFFSQAPLGMAIIDVLDEECDIIAVMANEKHSQSYGLTPEQMVGKRYRQDLGIDKECIDFVLEKYKECDHTKDNIVQMELSVYRPFLKETRDVSVVVSLLGQESGRKRYAAITTDITANKLVAEELQQHKDHLKELVKLRTEELFQSEERFRTLVTSAPNIILTVDNMTGEIQFVNRPILNFPRDPVGEIVWDIFSNVELKNELLHPAPASDSILSCEAKLVGDTEKWCSLSIKKMNKDCSIIVATDITEVKLLADKLNSAMQAKSRFLANMSHEVRTPLSAIIGMCQYLSESGLTSEQIDTVDIIRQCSEVLLAVMNDVLDYSKAEIVGLKLCPTEMSLVKCLEDSVYMVVDLAHRKGLELVIDVDPGIPDRLVADVVRIRQIMLNVLNNAVKFTDSGYILVSVSAKSLDDSNLWEFSFCVKDTGCGIPPGNEERIFEMFSQLDVSTTRKYGGTGIGLAYARRLIDAMQGKIWVESAGIPGEGSSFYFTLLLQPSTNPDPLFIPPSPLVSYTIHSPPKVVILDSSCVSREAMCKRLVKMGFVVEQFSCLEDLEHLLKRNRKSYIVFMEVRLYQECFNKYHKCATVSVILMGSRAYPPAWAEEKGYLHYLHKPIKVVPLAKAITRALHKFELDGLASSGNTSSPEQSLSEEECDEKLLRRASVVDVDMCDTSLNILIVEDNFLNQKVIGRMFTKLGFSHIAFAGNGKEALAHLDHEMPDFIIMDVQMPEMDGVECTKKIRALYGPSWPHIITVTADVFIEDELKCREAGSTDFLTKPLCNERLKQCLHKCSFQKEIRLRSETIPKLAIIK